MEIIYFTVAGIFLYFFSDWMLDRFEAMAGRRFEYRSFIFFVIILVLSMSLFNLVQYFQTKNAESSPEKVMMDKPGGGEAQDVK